MCRLLMMMSLLLSCASAAPVTVKDVPATEGDPPAGAAGGDDLSKAFDPEEEKVKPVIVRPVEAPPVDLAAGFKAALADGQAALKARELDAARTAAATAAKEAASLDGEARHQAGQLAFKVELAGGNAGSAEDAATAWRLACGPEKADACRSAALAGLISAAKLKGADKKQLKHARELQDAEVCAAKAEGASKPLPCESEALHLAQTGRDPYLAQRIQLAHALREESAGLLEKAEGHCVKPQCAAHRRKALGKLIALARAKNETDVAVKLALREVAIVASALPEDGKAWARTGMLDQTCVSYDTAHGAGSCRALERKTLGRWTFHDYSREESPSQGLTADQVRMVNDHFSPLLQECLAEQARRMTPPDAQRFEVRWVVFNDGRVGEVHLRKEFDETQLAKCLRAQFNGWRYPRYEGEYQNVEQSFTVSAVERR